MQLTVNPVAVACLVVLITVVWLAWIAKKKTTVQISLREPTSSQETVILPKLANVPSLAKSFPVEEKDSLDKHLDMLTKSLAEKEGRLRISKSKFREKKKEIENLNSIDDSLKEKYDDIMENLRRDLATNEKECKKLQDRIEWVSQQRAELKEEIQKDYSVVGSKFFVASAAKDFNKNGSCCCSKRQTRRSRLQSPTLSPRSSCLSRSRSSINSPSGSRRKDFKRRSFSKVDCPYSDFILNIDDILKTMKMIESESVNNDCTRQPPKWMNQTSNTNTPLSGIPSTSKSPFGNISCPKTCKQFQTKAGGTKKKPSPSPDAPNKNPKTSENSTDDKPPTSKMCCCPDTCKPFPKKTTPSEAEKNSPYIPDASDYDPKTVEKSPIEVKPTTFLDSPTLLSFIAGIKPCPCTAKSTKNQEPMSKENEFTLILLESDIKPPPPDGQPCPEIEPDKTIQAYTEYIPTCPKDCFSKLFDQDAGFVNPSYKESSSRMTIDSSAHSFGKIVEEELRLLNPMKKRKVMIKILEQIED